MASSTRETADVVLVGGGIFGCAIAWSLKRAGVERVHLVEREGLATQTTSRAAALLTRVRTKPGQTELVCATRSAIPLLGEELGEPLDLRQVGSIHLAASERTEREIGELHDRAQALEEPVRWLDMQELRERLPWIDVSSIRAATLMPGDAHMDPYLLATAYGRAARRRGALLEVGREVTGLRRSGSRVIGVQTDRGPIDAGTVVDCAGPWAGLLAHELGLYLPMAPVRSHYWITAAAQQFEQDQPFVILPDAHAYARTEVGGLLFGLRDRQSLSRDPRQLPRDLSQLEFEEDPRGWKVLEESGPAFAAFFPSLWDLELAHYVAGPSTYTPDGQFVLGACPGVEGFLVATGCCGAGIAASGGVGEAIARLVVEGTGGDCDEGLEPFRVDRFGTIDPFSESWLERCAGARSRKAFG